jgi:aspartate/methionine/tyrosine aminotransferase
MSNNTVSDRAKCIRESITHGTKARIAELNTQPGVNNKVIDLSIGSLDEKTSNIIDEAVINFIKTEPNTIHDFCPVPGFNFLRKAVSERVKRLRDIDYSAEHEIMITPGGIKGAISVVFHTILNPKDEVVVPLPNWPHYSDMIELHGACVKGVYTKHFRTKGITADDLEGAITPQTKMVILGDCVNPSGKIYSIAELESLAEVIAKENMEREIKGSSPIHVLFDCPYESHILTDRPATISSVTVELQSGRQYSMRDCTSIVTGPGKTYGMHGDRIGYICSERGLIEHMEKVQVNLNSFASTYGQIATYAAMQPDMDKVAFERARRSRRNLSFFLDRLNQIPGVAAPVPEGGYFAFLDLTSLKGEIQAQGYSRADDFLLNEARVATISGAHFAEDVPEMDYFVRVNCGRSRDVLEAASDRISRSVNELLALAG